MEHVAPKDESAYRDGYRDGFRDGMDQGNVKNHEEAGGGGEKDGQKEGGEKDGQKEGGQNSGQADQKQDHGAGDPKHKPLYKRPLVVAIVLAAVLALLIAGIILWRHSRSRWVGNDYQKYAIGPGMSVEPNVTVH
jgi:hypothetical protein